MVEDKIKPYTNWIFDWSGTLVDDLEMVIAATNHVFGVYARPEISREDFKAKFRLPYIGFYQEMLPGVPLPELETHFRAGFTYAKASGIVSPLLPHALEFLRYLNKRDQRMFILSSMDASAFNQHAQELKVDHYFEASYAGVLDKKEQIHQILKTHQLEPEDTVFLGDMTHDIETAQHGGISSIALLTGYQSEAQLTAVQPDYLMQDLDEVRRRMHGSTPINPIS